MWLTRLIWGHLITKNVFVSITFDALLYSSMKVKTFTNSNCWHENIQYSRIKESKEELDKSDFKKKWANWAWRWWITPGWRSRMITTPQSHSCLLPPPHMWKHFPLELLPTLCLFLCSLTLSVPILPHTVDISNSLVPKCGTNQNKSLLPDYLFIDILELFTYLILFLRCIWSRDPVIWFPPGLWYSGSSLIYCKETHGGICIQPQHIHATWEKF